MKYDYIKKRNLDRQIYDKIIANIRINGVAAYKRQKIEKQIEMIEKTTTSRVVKKFLKKLAFRILLPIAGLVAWVTTAFILATVFGIPEQGAVFLSFFLFFGIPSLIYMVISFYKESKREVSEENKKLMDDLRGNF